MHIQSDRALIPAGTPSTRYLSVTISAPAAPPPAAANAARPKRPGVDVSLVLDRSGSMGGRKMSLAQQAVAHAIRLLKGDDQLSVVVYDSEVDTVLERTAATRQAKQRALAALAQIDARGATDLAEGWYTGRGRSAPRALLGASRGRVTCRSRSRQPRAQPATRVRLGWLARVPPVRVRPALVWPERARRQRMPQATTA